MKILKKLGKWALVLLLVLLVGAGGLVGYLTIAEYSPPDVENIVVAAGAKNGSPQIGQRMAAVSWNIGYAALGRGQDFFMDGGKMVRPGKKQDVEENLAGITSALSLQQADIYLLQEVDLNSHRSYGINEVAAIERGLMMSSTFARNYKCDFVPFPWPVIGRVESGLQTLSGFHVEEATRESLPVPFTWPMRVANLKRCLLVERIPVQNSEKELVLINVHMEAYDNGEGKRAQTEQLMKILQAEYRKGNYVLVGGDFNQNFPGVTQYPLLDESYWAPGLLAEEDLPAGFSFVFDASAPTCRLLNEPYSGDRSKTQFYVIDGFILSENIRVNHVQTIDANFRYSDHHPVRLEFTLLADPAA